jgi:hypothetical protein
MPTPAGLPLPAAQDAAKKGGAAGKAAAAAVSSQPDLRLRIEVLEKEKRHEELRRSYLQLEKVDTGHRRVPACGRVLLQPSPAAVRLRRPARQLRDTTTTQPGSCPPSHPHPHPRRPPFRPRPALPPPQDRVLEFWNVCRGQLEAARAEARALACDAAEAGDRHAVELRVRR